MLRKVLPVYHAPSAATPAEINISQKTIRPKIRALLRTFNYSKATIRAFKRGYCNGLAAIALYSFYLEAWNREHPEQATYCDWSWLKKTLERLATWDRQLYSLCEEDLDDITYLISLMEYFQHASSYVIKSQGSLHELLEDTAKRKPKQEYTFAGLFTCQDFTKTIQLEIGHAKVTTRLIDILLKYEKRMIIISRGGHSLGLFRCGDTISLYNANSGRSIFTKDNIQDLILALFRAYHFKPNVASPFGFRIYTFDKHAAIYPKQSLVLASLNPPSTSGKYSAIHIAARIGSTDSAAYYLRDKESVDRLSKSKRSPLYVAASKGYLDLVQLLLTHHADPLKSCRHGKSPLTIAASKGHVSLVKVMLESKRNCTSANLFTALHHLPLDSQRVALLQQLDEKKLLHMTNDPCPAPLIKTMENKPSLFRLFNPKPTRVEPVAHPSPQLSLA